MGSNNLYRETVKTLLHHRRIDLPMETVSVSPMPPHLVELAKECDAGRPKACYRNILLMLLALDNNRLSPDQECFYILGYANISGIPIEHALLYLNGCYYDPTYELNQLPLPRDFIVALHLHPELAFSHAERRGLAPDIHTVMSHQNRNHPHKK